MRAVRKMKGGGERYYSLDENGEIIETSISGEFVKKIDPKSSMGFAFRVGNPRETKSETLRPRDEAIESLKKNDITVNEDGSLGIPEDLVPDEDSRRFVIKKLRAIQDKMVQDERYDTPEFSLDNSIEDAIDKLEAGEIPGTQNEPVEAQVEPDTNQDETNFNSTNKLESGYEIPSKYSRSVSEARRGGLSDAQIQSLIEGIENGERNDEGTAAMRTRQGRSLMEKSNRLLLDFRATPSKDQKGRNEAEREG